jgi:glycogen debranching enzyme
MIHPYTVSTPLGDVVLASDEELVEIERCEIVPPRVIEDPLTILLRMASATDPAMLGAQGPVIASLANEENATNPELRRYEAKFGRDALYAAEFLSEAFPQLEEGTVRYFAAYQATGWDPRRLSAPGKVPNHIRDPSDPLAQRLSMETGRRWPWFGGTDTTVQFLSAACRMLNRHADAFDEVVRYPNDHQRSGQVVMRGDTPLTIGRTVTDAAGWLLRKLRDRRGRSLVWAGLNRKDSFTVWTDSPNAFHHRDGTLAKVPVAAVQLQAQAFDALTALASLTERHPQLHLDPMIVHREASAVRAKLVDRFVVTDGRGTFLACGVEDASCGYAPLAIRTVNMGFVLDSDVLAEARFHHLREDIISQLFSPEMSSSFGFTGRARDEVRFTPFDYHAQVWAFASYKVARGLRRLGYYRLAREVEARILRQTRDGLLPENVGAGTSASLQYCPHVLTVARPAPDGRRTVTVKERPPAPYAAWTAAAVVAIRASKTDGGTFTSSPFEDELLDRHLATVR